MTDDESIIFRVFSYGFHHADLNRTIENGRYILPFPEPKIIYFCPTKHVPSELTLELHFPDNNIHEYTVSTFNYLATTPEELTDKKMIILIPFESLKLREVMKKERSQKNLDKLKYLIQYDILNSIEINLQAGNITRDDARKLRRLTHSLYHHIYAHYHELKEITEMTDESLMLDIDIIEKEHEKAMAEKDSIIAEKDNVIIEKDNEIHLLKKQLAELTQSK
jgi:hypothetical protein